MKKIKWIQLSEIAELITKGTTPTTMGFDFQENGVNFLKIECFDENGGFVESKVTHISEECNKKLRRSQLKEGDILFSIAGAIGRVAIVTKEMLPANTNQALAIIRIVDEQIYLPYVKLILTSPIVTNQLEKKKQGVAQLNLSLKDINEILMPLPSKKQQIELADLFKKVADVIYKRNAELLSLDNLIKARFVEMFGDCGNMVSMNDLCLIITDGTHQPPKFQETGIPFILVSNLSNNTVTYNTEKYISDETYNELYKRTPIEQGDLLLSTVGSYGHPAVVTENIKFLFQRHIAYLKPRRELVNSFYLHGALLAPDGQRQIEEKVKGIAQKTLNLSDIRKIMIPLPKLEEQNAFADFVHQVDKSKVAVQKALDETKLLFDSLMQKYFG